MSKDPLKVLSGAKGTDEDRNSAHHRGRVDGNDKLSSRSRSSPTRDPFVTPQAMSARAHCSTSDANS